MMPESVSAIQPASLRRSRQPLHQDQIETGPCALLCDDFFGGKHAAREDVTLDEIGGSAVRLKASLIYGDHLKDCGATSIQAFMQGLEVNRPIRLAKPKSP